MRRALIKTYEAQIEIIKFNKGVKEGFEKAERDRIEREEAQKRFDAYWTEHAKEKEQLELERKGLQEQIANLNASQNEQVAALNKEIETIPGQAEIDNIEVRIKKLSAEKASLGFFKGKEKKALQEQIDQTASEKSIIRERMEFAKKAIESKISAIKNDIQKELNTLQGRISDIDAELTKPR